MGDKESIDIYTDYLVSSFGLTTGAELSHLLNGAIGHDRIQRFLAGPSRSGKDLWQVIKPYVRQVQADDGVIIVDDSISGKPHTDENDIICWHYDHTSDQTIKGINFITALYHAVEVSLPVNYHLVEKTEVCTDTKTNKQKRRSPIPKNEVYRQLLREVKQNQIPLVQNRVLDNSTGT